jgi:cation diffusion facilitator CzcD-associated flavoprotein CzcO
MIDTGVTVHTARWDHSQDLAGKRVAIIGTGASAVQVIPAIAPIVARLTVFQRTRFGVSSKPIGRYQPDSSWRCGYPAPSPRSG